MAVRRGWLIALALIACITAFRVNSIQTTYMRDDEEIAFRTTSRDLSYTVWYQATQDVHAPLWFMSFWLWQQFIGDSEFMGRVYGILLSMLTLALIYRIARRSFGSAVMGWFGLAFLGVNAYFHIYSLEIRPYPLILLAAALSMLAFQNWLKLRTVGAALIYGLTVALMFYIHYFLAFLVAAQGLYALSWSRQTLRQLLLAYGLAFVIWSPWFVVFVGQVQHVAADESQFGNARGLAGIGSTTEPTTLDAVLRLWSLMTNGQPVLYAVILALGLLYGWRKRSFYLMLLWALGVPALALIANLIVAVYTPRYVAYLSLGFAIVCGAALAWLPRYLNGVALVIVVGISLWSLSSQFPLDRVPHRALFQQAAAAAQPGDVLYFDQGDLTNNVVLWQMSHYLPAYLQQSQAESVDAALQSRRIWYVTAAWFDPAVQANFRQIETSHPLQQVIGDCNRYWCYLIQRMDAPPLTEPLRFGENLLFGGFDLDAVSRERIEGRLWWQVEAPLTASYSFSLRLLDETGQLVTQLDGPVQQADGLQIDTTTMTPGAIYVDHRSLILPPDLTPGSYQLALVVYDWRTGEPLSLPDASSQTVLTNVQIP